MTENSQISHRIRQSDVARLPFTAGIALGISGLATFVLGLYTLKVWWGWLFIGLGIVVGATAAMLVLRVPWAPLAGAATALASLIISAIWVADYPWFNVATILFDVLAIYALARTKLRLWTGREPLRT